MTSRPKKSLSSKRENNHEGTKLRKPPAQPPSVSSRLRGAGRIEAATEIVPLWVAESIVNEAGAWLRTVLPAEWPAALAARAERCFAVHRQLHRLVCHRGNHGNAGLANLRRFMRHWLASRLARECPALFRRLAPGYPLGQRP